MASSSSSSSFLQTGSGYRRVPDVDLTEEGGHRYYRGRERAGSPSLSAKVKKKYWKTKQSWIEKRGKRQDEYVVAGDAQLDLRLEHMKSIQATSNRLTRICSAYRKKLTDTSDREQELADFLHAEGNQDESRAGKSMLNLSKVFEGDSDERIKCVTPLTRLHDEMETFCRRALADAKSTTDQMEKLRREYRGGLLWLKDASKNLDPEDEKLLQKYRDAQKAVKEAKRRFDRLKVDVCEKIEVLSASHCNLLSKSLNPYYQSLSVSFGESEQRFKELLDWSQSYHHHQYRLLKDVVKEGEASEPAEDWDSDLFGSANVEQSEGKVEDDEEKYEEEEEEEEGEFDLRKDDNGEEEEGEPQSEEQKFIMEELRRLDWPNYTNEDESGEEKRGGEEEEENDETWENELKLMTQKLKSPPRQSKDDFLENLAKGKGDLVMPSDLLDLDVTDFESLDLSPCLKPNQSQEAVSRQEEEERMAKEEQETADRQRKPKKKSPMPMSAWFNRFAELDPFANHDELESGGGGGASGSGDGGGDGEENSSKC